MAYDSSDPRAALAQSGTPSAPSHYAGAEYCCFHDVEPTVSDAGSETWYMRGQNFVVAYSEVKDSLTFSREQQLDEWVLLVPGSSLATVSLEWEGEQVVVPGRSIAFVPSGAARVVAEGSGQLVRLFTTQSSDVAELALNSDSYVDAHPNVASLVPWAEAIDGPKIHLYSLDVPKEEGRFGRIFRCSTFMVNFLDPTVGPRDTSRMSPHTHDDFEQCSLAVEGDYFHHIRWPWGTNKAQWREDDHRHCPSPSMVVIPPPAIHTSQAVGEGVNQLVDIFCPPRVDFSQKAGWVLNAKDYPSEHDSH